MRASIELKADVRMLQCQAMQEVVRSRKVMAMGKTAVWHCTIWLVEQRNPPYKWFDVESPTLKHVPKHKQVTPFWLFAGCGHHCIHTEGHTRDRF